MNNVKTPTVTNTMFYAEIITIVDSHAKKTIFTCTIYILNFGHWHFDEKKMI